MEFNSKSKSLSEREKQVLLLIAYEYTNAGISERLIISKGTVSTYRNNILHKLSANNSAGLIRKAFECGLLVLDKDNKIILAGKNHLKILKGKL